jgi:GTP-binding protein Era
VYTETESQKYIIVWRSWSLITQIGTEARIELEQIFWKKVFLSLRVKTMEKWRKNDRVMKKLLS